MFVSRVVLALSVMLPFAGLTATIEPIETRSDINWIAVSHVSKNTVWIGGSGGTIGRSSDSGATWTYSQPGDTDLEFRDIEALDDQRAYALSVGDGTSRIFYTSNGGERWQQRYRAPSDQFLNCMAVAPTGEAWVFGDSTSERWQMVRSADGRNWVPVRNVVSEPPQSGEGGFASSGGCIRFNQDTWAIATGNGVIPRVLIKGNYGIRFQVVDTPMPGGPMAGITSVWPYSEEEFLIAGGDLNNPDATPQLFHYRNDEFEQIAVPVLQGALYSLLDFNGQLLVTNPSGAALKQSDSDTWELLSDANIWNSACHSSGDCYLVGKDGFVGRLQLSAD